LLEHPHTFGGIVEILFLVEVELVVAQTAAQYFANTLLIDNDVLRSERVMQNLILIEVGHREHAAAEDGHELLG
jgi:hypothetical protein